MLRSGNVIQLPVYSSHKKVLRIILKFSCEISLKRVSSMLYNLLHMKEKKPDFLINCDGSLVGQTGIVAVIILKFAFTMR